MGFGIHQLEKIADFHPLSNIVDPPIVDPILQGDLDVRGNVIPGSYVEKKNENLGVVDFQQTATFFSQTIAAAATLGWLTGGSPSGELAPAEAGGGFTTSSAPEGYFAEYDTTTVVGSSGNDTLSAAPANDTLTTAPSDVQFSEELTPATGSGAPSAETTNAEQAFIQGSRSTGGGGILSTLNLVNAVAATVGTVARLFGGGGAPPPVSSQGQAPQLGRTYFLPPAESSAPGFYARPGYGAGGGALPGPSSSSSTTTLVQIAGGIALAVALVWTLKHLRG